MQFQFEWNDAKADSNLRKHGVSFELARTVFEDPLILTIADIDHSESDERWFSIGAANNLTIISVVYLWSEIDADTTRVRIISARKATRAEIRYYQRR